MARRGLAEPAITVIAVLILSLTALPMSRIFAKYLAYSMTWAVQLQTLPIRALMRAVEAAFSNALGVLDPLKGAAEWLGGGVRWMCERVPFPGICG